MAVQDGADEATERLLTCAPERWCYGNPMAVSLIVIFGVLMLVMILLAGLIWLIFDRKRTNREPR